MRSIRRMRKSLIAAVVLLLFAGSFWAAARLAPPAQPREQRPAEPRRIVSMAPSITELLFALGLGDRVVGVTRFCQFPPAARTKPQIGGFLDPNLEAVVALHPDLVVVLVENELRTPGLAELRLPLLTVNHQTVEGVVESIGIVGRHCGRDEAARQLEESIRTRMAAVQRRSEGLPRPRVLMAVDRTRGTGAIQDVYVAGHDGYFSRLIELAGGENAMPASAARFPVVSAEGVLSINPDVIIDLAGGMPGDLDDAAIRRDWDALPQVDAVRRQRVYVISDEHLGIPGPSFVDLLEKMSEVIPDPRR